MISSQSTIEDAMRRLNEGIGGVVVCVDDDQIVRGILTDGDIRRAILEGKALDAPLESCMNINFRFGTSDMSETEILQILGDTVRHVPVLEDGRLIDLVSWGELWRLPVTQPSLGGNEMKYLADCINTAWISSQGKYIERFEDSFTEYHSGMNAVCTSSGTTALHLALTALDIGPGDEVIVPNTTFGATANTVIHCGAKPVFVDIEPYTRTMDPDNLSSAITKSTKAVIPVHLYGHPCDMDPILELAKQHQIWVIEDCAEALGAEYKGKKVGTLGHIGCFSFFANKVITTGEGGMALCRDDHLADRLRLLRDHGMSKERRYWHLVAGFNYRMTNLQAAIGLAQMEQLDKFLFQRERIASRYSERLSIHEGLCLPKTREWAKNIHWLYSVEIDSNLLGIDRDQLTLELDKSGVETRPVFPPLHSQPAYSLEDNDRFPVSKKFGAEGMSLPTSNSLSVESVDHVCDAIDQILRNYNRQEGLV